MNSFHESVKAIIKSIPRGRVATYGQIAACAGSPRASRQVSWVLRSCSARDDLPWHRVINRKGGISLKAACGYELQRVLLEKEGVEFEDDDRIDLEKYRAVLRLGRCAEKSMAEDNIGQRSITR